MQDFALVFTKECYSLPKIYSIIIIITTRIFIDTRLQGTIDKIIKCRCLS